MPRFLPLPDRWLALKLAIFTALMVLLALALPPSLLDVTRTAPSPPAPAESLAPTPRPVAALAAPEPAPAQLVVSSVLQPDRPLQPGDYLWEPDGVPAGQLRILVDLDQRTIHAFRGGAEIGRAAIIYGADDKPTPRGTFPILEKDADHVSNLYDAPMPWMLRLTIDGVAIHGSEVDAAYATHGCIGVPDEFGEALFGAAQVGDQVIVTGSPAADQA